MNRYEAKLDQVAKMITVALFCVLVIPVSSMIVQIGRGHWELIIILAVLAAALILAYIYRPLYYTVDRECLQVRRTKGNLTIPLKDIAEIKPISKEELGFGYRKFGVGGFYGYFGRFRYKSVGNVTLYATDQANMVLIKTRGGEQIIISPHNREAFLEHIRKMICQVSSSRISG